MPIVATFDDQVAGVRMHTNAESRKNERPLFGLLASAGAKVSRLSQAFGRANLKGDPRDLASQYLGMKTAASLLLRRFDWTFPLSWQTHPD